MSDLINDNLSWKNYCNNLKVKSREAINPLIANLELTPRCNFNCRMCYVHLTDAQAKNIGKEHTAAEWIDIGKQLLKSGTLLLLLTGGEVFLLPDFREIYEAFSQMGFILHIYTNGYLIDDKILEWLSRCPPMVLRITIYGATNETYEKVTGVKYAFDRVMYNIERIIDAKIPLSLAATIIKENAADLEAMQKIAKDKGLQFSYTDNVVKPVRGAQLHKKNSAIKLSEMTSNKIADKDRVEKLFDIGQNAFSRCGSNGCGFWITWDGKMTICSFIGEPCTSPFDHGFDKAWVDLQDKLSAVKKPEKCIECKYAGFCFACPGIFASETGSLDRISEAICSNAKKMYEKYSISYLQEVSKENQ